MKSNSIRRSFPGPFRPCEATPEKSRAAVLRYLEEHCKQLLDRDEPPVNVPAGVAADTGTTDTEADESVAEPALADEE